MKLAQMNIAQAKYAFEAPEMKDFIDNMESIYTLAESSRGFIWRLKADSADTKNIDIFNKPNTIVNMSVWESVETLKKFMYKTRHLEFLHRKKEWFNTFSEETCVLWWVKDNHVPTVREGVDRLMHLRENGNTSYAFTLESDL